MKSEVKAALIRFHKCFVIQPARWMGGSQGGSETTCSVPPAFLSHLSQPPHPFPAVFLKLAPSSDSTWVCSTLWWRSKGCG